VSRHTLGEGETPLAPRRGGGEPSDEMGTERARPPGPRFAKPGGRCYSLADHARALAVILGEEFDAPFLFQDARTGESVSSGAESRGASDWGEGVPRSGGSAQGALEARLVGEVASAGRALVTPLSGGRYRVVLPLYGSGQPILVASATLTGLARGDADTPREHRRLAKWAQSVCERLRGSDYILTQGRGAHESGGPPRAAWEAILALDHLLRHLRVYKNTPANQQSVLRAAFGLLGVGALFWVPYDPSAAVLVEGEGGLAPADCRQLALLLARHPGIGPSAPLLCNDPHTTSWAGRFPSVSNVMAFAVAEHKPVGWVLALNKKSASGQAEPFRQSDAALLTPFAALLKLQARTADRHRDLKDLLVGLTRSLTAALDAKDAHTAGHSERVARVAVELGRELGLDEDEVSNLYLTGLLHDIGKIGVRDEVLGKPEPLTAEESEHLKQHVTIGYTILADVPQVRDLLPGVLYHHEHYDGSGYPDGLAAEEIPLLARILAVADAYDELSTSRPYRSALPCHAVEEALARGAGKQWDRRVVDAFLRRRQSIHTVRQRGVGESLRHALDRALRFNDSIAAPTPPGLPDFGGAAPSPATAGHRTGEQPRG
jgi:HD-GYP domain-containing protein (c-di-GMP phosphodiesterase class II)